MTKCVGSSGGFTGANSATLLGFLNFFLWTGNLWFLYKETAWFSGNRAGGEGMKASELEEDDLEVVEE